MEGAYNVIVSNKLSIGPLYCQWNFGTVLISQRPQNCSNRSAFDVSRYNTNLPREVCAVNRTEVLLRIPFATLDLTAGMSKNPKAAAGLSNLSSQLLTKRNSLPQNLGQ